MATSHFSSVFAFEPGWRNRLDRLLYNPFFRQYEGLCIKSLAANVNYIDFSWILRIKGRVTDSASKSNAAISPWLRREGRAAGKNAFKEKAFSQTLPNMEDLPTYRVMLHLARACLGELWLRCF